MTDLERVKKVVDWLIFNKIVKSRRELAEKMNYTESSMSPTIQEGSKILCQRIDEGKWETASGVVVIVYGKTLTVKRILHNDIFLNNRLVLKADNELHGQVDIPLESIRGIWQAVKEVQSESKIIVPKATLPINTALTKQNPKNKDGKK